MTESQADEVMHWIGYWSIQPGNHYDAILQHLYELHRTRDVQLHESLRAGLWDYSWWSDNWAPLASWETMK